MVETDWDKRYRDGFYDGAMAAHELLKKFWPAIPKGRVIDEAMGNGRDAAFLAEKGFEETVSVYGGKREAVTKLVGRKR